MSRFEVPDQDGIVVLRFGLEFVFLGFIFLLKLAVRRLRVMCPLNEVQLRDSLDFS